MITVLTEKFDVIDGPGYLFRSVRTYLHRIRTQGFSYLKNQLKKKTYTGHYAVTRSLCEGLRQAGISFKYNPRYSLTVSPHVVVLSGIETLRAAIALKEKGQVKRIFAGPNLMVRSHEYDRLLADPAIDRVLVPSEWVKTAYLEDLPALANRIMVWPAGVDSVAFKPLPEKKPAGNILIYWKNAPESLLEKTEALIGSLGYNATVIRYGSYHRDAFKEALDRCDLAVFYSLSESQGLALQEAWSMDVPTLVWQTQEPVVISGKRFTEHSAAPYLSAQTGRLFSTMEELAKALTAFRSQECHFAPRRYVLEHLTDEHCARKLAQALITKKP